MPIYDFKCGSCGSRREAFARDPDERLPCACGESMARIPSMPMVNAAFLGSTRNPGYHCVVTDQWVDSKRKRLEIMREHNLVEKG